VQFRSIAALCTVLLTTAACDKSDVNPKVPPGAKSSGGRHAVIETDEGAIEIEFLQADAPKAVENFRLLAEHAYYDGLTFHRIVRGFMIQGAIRRETAQVVRARGGRPSRMKSIRLSAVSRRLPARPRGDGQRRPNTNGSQFFILHQDYPLRPTTSSSRSS
jgi:cyclophilin family peptidyl-prolyl cis-trans isomerase